jgi:hypothetical protein
MMLLQKLWGYVVGLGAIVLGLLGLFAYAKRQGKKDEQAVETEKSLQQAKESNDIEAKNRALSDAAARNKLRGDQRD